MKNESKFLGNELDYLKRVLDSETWNSTDGSWTGNLESEFASRFEKVVNYLIVVI